MSSKVNDVRDLNERAHRPRFTPPLISIDRHSRAFISLTLLRNRLSLYIPTSPDT
jgi:hypothetical protein